MGPESATLAPPLSIGAAPRVSVYENFSKTLPYPTRLRYNRSMTETTTVTIEVEIPVIPHEDKVSIGEGMVELALAEWYRYNDEGTFRHETELVSEDDVEYSYTLTDPDEDASVTFTDSEFFDKHLELIWLATIKNYRHDWIKFAFKANDAPYDEYDALTVDAVLQNMLYGEIVYG